LTKAVNNARIQLILTISDKHFQYSGNSANYFMSSKHERDYIAKHQQIRNKLIEMGSGTERACVDVAQLASQLRMDIRTIRSHLKIMEVDAVGVFMDPGEKQFCTKEGVALLANMLNLNKKAGD